MSLDGFTQTFKFIFIEPRQREQLFGKTIELIFLHAGNLAHLSELGIAGRLQNAADFLPGLLGAAGRFLAVARKLVSNHMFNTPLLFFKCRKKILRFDLPASNQNNQQNNSDG